MQHQNANDMAPVFSHASAQQPHKHAVPLPHSSGFTLHRGLARREYPQRIWRNGERHRRGTKFLAIAHQH